LMLDLMCLKVFTCIRRRMMARSSDASTCLAGGGGRMDGRGSKAVARSLRCTRERESDGGRRRGIGSTPPRAALFIGRPPNLSILVPSTVQYASTAPSREVREKIKVDFWRSKSQLQPKSEFRSLVKKTTSGRPHGKSFCKSPRYINIGLWQIISPNRPST
jgi:hypothetical protein